MCGSEAFTRGPLLTRACWRRRDPHCPGAPGVGLQLFLSDGRSSARLCVSTKQDKRDLGEGIPGEGASVGELETRFQLIARAWGHSGPCCP